MKRRKLRKKSNPGHKMFFRVTMVFVCGIIVMLTACLVRVRQAEAHRLAARETKVYRQSVKDAKMKKNSLRSQLEHLQQPATIKSNLNGYGIQLGQPKRIIHVK